MDQTFTSPLIEHSSNINNLNNANVTKIYNLKELHANAYSVIKSEKHINIASFEQLLQNYQGNDWKNYVSLNSTISSTKNNFYNKTLVYQSTELEMYIITWPINSESKIHDHPENGCIMKILSGEVLEEEYANISESPKYVNTNILTCGKIGFKKGKELLHKIKNISNDVAVSIHFYTKCEYDANIYN